jgi:hypothetical protein
MRRRTGFTITELLVSLALVIFIMSILAEAFSEGLGTFRSLKAIGDMNEKLRSASTTIRRYLAADHFEGKKRLSDPNFWKDGPPREGYLRVYHGSAAVAAAGATAATANVYEGNDPDGVPSYRSTDHAVAMMVRLRGNNQGNYFRADVPGASPLLLLPSPDSRFAGAGVNPFTSPLADVAFYLRPALDAAGNQDKAEGDLPLYALYMRQQLMVTDNVLVTAANGGQPVPAQPGFYAEVSAKRDPANANNLYFNGPIDITQPVRRFGMVQNGGNFLAGLYAPTRKAYPTLADDGAPVVGTDLLLTDVISFDVRLLWAAYNPATGALTVAPQFVDLYDPGVQAFNMNNPAFQGNGPRVFDTWSSVQDNVYDYSAWATAGAATTVPLYQNAAGQTLTVRAVQITIRIWDSKTSQTRQTSVVVDL